MPRQTQEFQAIRSEGGLLPPDLLRRVLDPRSKLAGTRPEDYGLPENERLNEVIIQSWNRLRKHWTEFRAAAAKLPKGEAGTGLTNDKWNLPLMRELGFGILQTSPGRAIGGRTYAISRFYGSVPIHLIGCGLSLDHRAAGQRGAASANPHGLVQEFLNRSPDHIWAVLSNGLRFRILRDNQALSRQSFLEFDLENMFDGEIYSDFVLLWLMAHASRFLPHEEGKPETCWLEKWAKEAEEQGARALGDLRGGVGKAIQFLGEGFTGHPKNTALRDALRTGKTSPSAFHGQLLRVVYRLIFLFVAEDRTVDGLPLLHPRDDADAARVAREHYASHYSTARLRELAGKIKGSRHGDLWRHFQIPVRALSEEPDGETARQRLALPSFGGFLWSPPATADLNDAELTNHDFLEALRHLAFTRQGKVLRPVDYRNLGAEELGGVYECLLALTPQISADGARFTFAELAGNERKLSGSYYTPDALVACLLDTALDPAVEQAIGGRSGSDAEKAILELKICDPAVGSGHFLVGAAHRLAWHLARVRAHAQGESEPSPLAQQQALRDVIRHCLYGVDINPMAAELCRVSLWLESMEPGKPLPFIDHHIRVGNSLLGATPGLIAGGLPDEAFDPLEGDDRKVCASLKKINKNERKGQLGLNLMVPETSAGYDSLESRFRGLDDAPDDTVDAARCKAEQFSSLIVSQDYRHAQLLADTWCAAFVWEKNRQAPEAVTTDTVRRLGDDPDALAPAQRQEVERLAGQYHFFHWHLAFPEVFAKGGFDCVLGNPPWERVKLQEKEWFAERSPEIANAPNAAARKRLIEELKAGDPTLYQCFLYDLRTAEGESRLLRNSGRYPLCGRGDINLYAVFAEGMRNLLNDRGRMGCVLPTGIATDDTTKFYFQHLGETKSLVSLFSFENEEFIFPEVHHATRFCLLTTGNGAEPVAEAAQFVFFARRVEHLREPERKFTLSAEDIELLNPNTRTCPIFRSRKDAEISKAIYRRVPVLIREGRGNQPEENPWSIRFRAMFHMANDSHLFHTRQQLEAGGWRLEGNIFCKDGEQYLPLYEAKMIHHFDHRWGTYEGQTEAQFNQGKLPELDETAHADASFLSLPRYWVSERDLDDRIGDIWNRRWLIGFRDVTGATVLRTVIATVLPRVAANHKTPLIFVDSPVLAVGFVSAVSSFVLDYVSRQKVGGSSLTFFYFKQFPVVAPSFLYSNCSWLDADTAMADWLSPRALELMYTAWDLEPFAKDCGWSGPPFRWNEERRFLLRCEIDASFLHLYLAAEKGGAWRRPEGETEEELRRLMASFPTPRDAVTYIMDTFPIVRQRDEERFGGEYRTKRVILEIYDAMQEAIRTGRPYQTRLDPPPADPRCCHPPRKDS